MTMADVKLKDVPDSDVDDTVAQLKTDGCSNVEKNKQPNGSWTVTATCPD